LTFLKVIFLSFFSWSDENNFEGEILLELSSDLFGDDSIFGLLFVVCGRDKVTCSNGSNPVLIKSTI